MAIPKSTFVMGVVTLGLFGVAIYQTTGKKDDRRHAYGHDDDYDDDVDEDYDEDHDEDFDEAPHGSEALEEFGRREAEKAYVREQRIRAEAKAKAEVLAEKTARMRELVGGELAMPGPLFAGIELDATAVPANAAERVAAFQRATGVTVEVNSGAINDRFVVRFTGMDYAQRTHLCDELHNRLGTTWGSAYLDDGNVEEWTNNLTGIRASFTPHRGCELVFERFDTPQAWFSTTRPSTVPYTLIGKPVTALDAIPGVTPDGETFVWSAHGLGAGPLQTRLQAWAPRGKISSITARTVVNQPTEEALEEHLRRELGTPKITQEGARDRRLEWTNKRVVVLLGNGGIVMMLGTR